MNPIPAFRLGPEAQKAGITEAAVREAVACYDVALHEAPIVVGHPSDDAPAYGWVEGAVLEGDTLMLMPRQVAPAFAEWVRQGRYKKRSVSFYRPAFSPVPGKYYIRHLGFLGAQPPRIKGLEDYQFAGEAEGAYVELSEDASSPGAAGKSFLDELFRRISAWVAEQRAGAEPGAATTDNAEPDPAPTDPAPTDPAPTDPAPTDLAMKTELDAAQADLAAAQKDLEAREAAFAEREEKLQQAEVAQEKAEGERLRAECADFVESLVSDGARILPVWKDTFVETLALAEIAEVVVDFGEDGGGKKSLADALRQALSHMESLVDFTERAPAGDAVVPGAADPEVVARAAQDFVEQEAAAGRTVSYAAAVGHVRKHGLPQ